MKILKIIGFVILGILIFLFAAFNFIKYQTKKISPQAKVLFEKNENGKDVKITVEYSRPYKKGRKIFGGLVPFGEVWRTGANEATVFNTTSDLKVGSNTLPAGKYTLWTIPAEDSWTVIFNKKDYLWGIGDKGKASRDPQFDALEIKVPVEKLDKVVEQFEIQVIEKPEFKMSLAWDQTQVSVPFQLK